MRPWNVIGMALFEAHQRILQDLFPMNRFERNEMEKEFQLEKSNVCKKRPDFN